MAADTTRIGFISAGGAGGPHFVPFRALIPQDVEIDFEGLGLSHGARQTSRLDAVLNAAHALVDRGCRGIVVSGAPGELQSPEMPDRLRETVKVPTTTAMRACSAGLHALGAKRVLLMCPFDADTTQKIIAYLKARDITAVSPSTAFGEIDEAMQLSPQEVYDRTTAAFKLAGDVDGVYFQGAVLDPLEVIERMEQDFGCPVVASNPAMLWFILKRLGLSYHIEGYGKLLREWPAAPA
jgi:maleate isomerase